MKTTLRYRDTGISRLIIGEDALREFIAAFRYGRKSGSKLFILADESTRLYCLEPLLDAIPELGEAKLLVIAPGEESKSIETATRLFGELLSAGADRHSWLINLGGGVVTDLGGFVASLCKRGIRSVNIPTSLIGQVDAAIGGKTGLNVGTLKNQVGTFHLPEFVVIHPGFLATLPYGQLISGIAELIKNLVVADAVTWKKIQKQTPLQLKNDLTDPYGWKKWVTPSIRAKLNLVRRDFKESGIRKALNFGHTIGHALESLSFSGSGKSLTHGEAVAAGMVCAAWLAETGSGLDARYREEIVDFLTRTFPPVKFSEDEIPLILDFIGADKKNIRGEARFSLISAPGKPRINVSCTSERIVRSLQEYRRLASWR